MPQIRARTVADLEYELREARQRLAQGERALRLARTRLEVFAARYQRTVGERFEQLRELRSRSGGTVTQDPPPTPRTPRPERPPGNAEFDRLYRELARRVHPDVSDAPGERAMRTRAMVELNAARETLDFDRARRLGDTFEGRGGDSGTDTETDDSVDEFERLLTAIERIEARLTAVTADAVRLRENKLYLLMEVVEAQERAGIDVLGETAADLDGEIAEARAAIAIGPASAMPALPTATLAPTLAEPEDLDLAGSSFWTVRLAAAALALAGGIALVAASLAASAPSRSTIVTAPSANARATQVASFETTPAPRAYLAVEREQSTMGRTTATVRIVIEGAMSAAERMSTLAEAARRELRSQQAVVVFAYASPDEIGGPYTVGRAYLSVDGKGWSGDGLTPDGPDSGGVVGSIVVMQGATTETRTFSAPR